MWGVLCFHITPVVMAGLVLVKPGHDELSVTLPL
jgi:hypothetical protein